MSEADVQQYVTLGRALVGSWGKRAAGVSEALQGSSQEERLFFVACAVAHDITRIGRALAVLASEVEKREDAELRRTQDQLAREREERRRQLIERFGPIGGQRVDVLDADISYCRLLLYVGDLCNMTARDVLDLPGIGQVRLRKIREGLRRHGLALRDEAAEAKQ